jgi:anti-sigma factor RsiW
MSLSCEQVLPLLSPYVDGELAIDEGARLERHLFSCERCKARLNALKSGSQALRDHRWERPSPQLARRIADLSADSAGRAFGLFQFATVIGALAAMVALLAYVALRPTGSPDGSVPVAGAGRSQMAVDCGRFDSEDCYVQMPCALGTACVVASTPVLTLRR